MFFPFAFSGKEQWQTVDKTVEKGDVGQNHWEMGKKIMSMLNLLYTQLYGDVGQNHWEMGEIIFLCQCWICYTLNYIKNITVCHSSLGISSSSVIFGNKRKLLHLVIALLGLVLYLSLREMLINCGWCQHICHTLK